MAGWPLIRGSSSSWAARGSRPRSARSSSPRARRTTRHLHLAGGRPLRGRRNVRHDQRRVRHDVDEHGRRRAIGAGCTSGPTASGSIDHAVIAYGGGTTTIEGGFGQFNAVEIHQAQVRIADSILEHNAGGAATATATAASPPAPATIFVRGAQPVIVNNIFQNNAAAAINIDVNSLNSDLVPDWGPCTSWGPPASQDLSRPTTSTPTTAARWSGGTALAEQRHQRHGGPRRRADHAVGLGRHRHRPRRRERNQRPSNQYAYGGMRLQSSATRAWS